MAKKVFIAPGHGGSDPGAVANGLKEKDLNLAISLACREELENAGVTVKMSRNSDTDETLAQQISECNAFDPDVAVNIHNNAGGGDGAEVYHSVIGGTGKVLANNILAAIVKLGQNSRGAKTRKNSSGGDYYGFIRQTAAPAVIVECAFVDNKTDIAVIDSAAEQKAMGVAIAKGILTTLGIANTVTTPKKEETYSMTMRQLKKGHTGEDVKALQILLEGRGYPCGKGATGNFGNGTEAAVRSYQKAKKLTVDGIAGPATMASLLGV